MDRLLKVLVATAAGILLFCAAVFGILHFTSGNDKTTKETTSSSSSVSSSSNNDNSSNSTSSSESSSTSSENNSEDSSTSASKSTNATSNSTSSSSQDSPGDKQLGEKITVPSSSNNASSSSNNASNSSNTNSSSSSSTNSGTNSVATNGKTLGAVGNTGKVFTSQQEAHSYGKAEIEARVKADKKYTEYEVRRVDYTDGTFAGWTVNIYQKDNASSTNTTTSNGGN